MAANEHHKSAPPAMAPGAARCFVGLQATAAVLSSVVLGLATGSVAPALVCFGVCCTALSGLAPLLHNGGRPAVAPWTDGKSTRTSPLWWASHRWALQSSWTPS
jgi:hypothetical protein